MSGSAESRVASVAILGGGLAGLAAASVLSTRGFRVTLLEARSRLGGRASSFVDPKTGEPVDNCQHVSMGCCTNLADFCRRVGIEGCFRRDPVMHFLGPGGQRYDLGPSGLPAPFHLAPRFVGLGFLDTATKLAVAHGLLRLARGGRPTEDEHQTFADWLVQHGQPEQARDRFWTTVLTSALSETCDRIDPRYARKVFVEGFLSHPAGSDLLLPTAPLEVLYGRRLIDWLSYHGVTIRLGCAARAVPISNRRVQRIELRDGTQLEADAYVATVPFDRLLKLLPAELVDREAYFSRLRRLESAPITGVHLWFDRPITNLPHAILVGRTAQWLFNRNALWTRNATDRAVGFPQKVAGSECRNGPDSLESGASVRSDQAKLAADRFYYQIVVSASYNLDGIAQDVIVARIVRELSEIWPAARRARLVHARVVTERSAVFSARPGVDRLRPPQQSPVENLWLAGDWTQTGWPATMEGAVRSGYLAAESILDRYGRSKRILKPGLPRAILARRLLG